jgi:glycosyltransferase involved in cell wall biosynthesis
MKLLLLISSLGSGGAERQLVTMGTLFHEQGLHVEFLVYHEDDFFKHILDEKGIKVNQLCPKNHIDRIIKVRRFIRKSDFDAVISFLEVNNFLASVSAIGGKRWKLITNELSSKMSTFNTPRSKVFNFFQRFSDTLVCNSHNAKLMWEKYYPKYKDKLKVIYNPVLLPIITSEYIPKRDGKLHIIVAASYQYLKNPIGLIKSLLLMNQENRSKIVVNWYGRIEVSKGNTRAYDESVGLIVENNLENVIHLNGPTKDIANKMNEADVVALFSELEGLPNAICEGMMIGKPIIMSKVSDYADLVDDTNGVLCDWDNPESIKYALLDAMQWSVDELREKGINSKNKAENLFSSKVIINQWIKLIR